MKVTKVLLYSLVLFLIASFNGLYSQTPCSGGMAGIYPCNQVDLKSYLNLSDLSAGLANDVWGWTDPGSGTEYAIIGLANGTSFVDISNPTSPVIVGKLPTHSTGSNITWRDIKIVNNHAYIGAEIPGHGIQIFDLTQLGSATPPATFAETGWIDLGSSSNRSHNVGANDDLDQVYALGTSGLCSGGITTYDASNPASPSFVGCNSIDGYSHDAICFMYRGLDANHIGKQICIGFNEDDVTIFDYSNPASPSILSVSNYANVGYIHQGWVTEDQKYLLVDDELDENNFNTNTRTYVYDISDLDSPLLVYTHTHATPAFDHNQYVRGPYVYQANYKAGMRILDVSDLDNSAPSEVAYFDVYPINDNKGFDGAWSVFPFYKSDCIAISGIEGTDVGGLFIVEPKLPHYVMSPIGLGIDTICQGESASFSFDMTQYAGFTNTDNLTVTGLPSGAVASFNANPAPTNSNLTLSISNTANVPSGNYPITITGTQTPVNRVTLGLIVCSQPDKVELSFPSNGATNVSVDPTFTWLPSANTDTYCIEVSTSPTFNTIDFAASNLLATSHTFTGLLEDQLYYWRVTAKEKHNRCQMVSEFFSFETENTSVPVTWLDFDSQKQEDGTVILNWSTANERNSGLFEILRSTNGVHFEKIGETEAIGNSTSIREYTFTDHFPILGWNYYKLKQIDLNGEFSFSKIESILFDNSHFEFTLSPNPNYGDEFLISFNADVEDLKFKLFNALGEQINLKINFVQNGREAYVQPLLSVPSGSYYLQIYNGSNLVDLKSMIVLDK